MGCCQLSILLSSILSNQLWISGNVKFNSYLTMNLKFETNDRHVQNIQIMIRNVQDITLNVIVFVKGSRFVCKHLTFVLMKKCRKICTHTIRASREVNFPITQRIFFEQAKKNCISELCSSIKHTMFYNVHSTYTLHPYILYIHHTIIPSQCLPKCYIYLLQFLFRLLFPVGFLCVLEYGNY